MIFNFLILGFDLQMVDIKPFTEEEENFNEEVRTRLNNQSGRRQHERTLQQRRQILEDLFEKQTQQIKKERCDNEEAAAAEKAQVSEL